MQEIPVTLISLTYLLLENMLRADRLHSKTHVIWRLYLCNPASISHYCAPFENFALFTYYVGKNTGQVLLKLLYHLEFQCNGETDGTRSPLWCPLSLGYGSSGKRLCSNKVTQSVRPQKHGRCDPSRPQPHPVAFDRLTEELHGHGPMTTWVRFILLMLYQTCSEAIWG